MKAWKKLALGIVMLLAIGFVGFLAMHRGPEVTVPASGPVTVEERVPEDPDQKAAFDRRKAASACRVAILQSAKSPSTLEFVDEIDKTPSQTESNGDYSFKIAVNARNKPGLVSSQLHCRAHREDSGWSIAELAERAKR